MPPIPHRVSVRSHPGSSLQEIEKEPNWGHGHEHRVGFRNGQSRVPGLTHSGDEREDSDPNDEIETGEAEETYEEFRKEVKEGKLVNFRDVIGAQEDFHLRRPDVHSEGWRYVLNAKEDWIKNVENWPANVERKKKEENAKKKKEEEEGSKEKNEKYTDRKKSDNSKEEKSQEKDSVQQEHEWKRENGESDKHHDAYAGSEGSDADAEHSEKSEAGKSEYEKLREKYSPQEIALLRSLQHEKDYIYSLKQNDGNMKSPVNHANPLVSIDEADQFSPDNWIPRSSNLIRLTGKVCSQNPRKSLERSNVDSIL